MEKLCSRRIKKTENSYQSEPEKEITCWFSSEEAEALL